MVFSSLIFVFFFLPFTLMGYYILGRRYRNLFLFAASILFYAWGEPVSVLLLLGSILFNYGTGIMIDKCRSGQYGRRFVLIAGLMVNIACLGFFKYAGLFGKTIDPFPLPLGISFYTFQALSYLVDIYRKDTPAQKSFIRFGLYISMFPQLVAGPIVNYKDISPFLETRETDWEHFSEGVRRFLTGLGKKVLLANQLGLLWAEVKSMPAHEVPPILAWMGILAFSLQIYFDFSGYSDMAIGLGKMFGFGFKENFNYPYLSDSISEFWRRWHISLGSWFKSYVYIPLGGSHGGGVRTVVNLLIVWLITGLWHGASWNFAVWGLYYGILIILEKALEQTVWKKCPAIVKHIYTIFFVMIGWVIFEFDGLTEGTAYLGAMFGITSSWAAEGTVVLLFFKYMIIIIIGIAAATDYPKRAVKWLSLSFGKLYYLTAVLFFTGITVISAAFMVGATYNPFLYFRF